MSWLLDRYSKFLGRQPRKQGEGFNGPCPLCGGDSVTSDRFMVWPHTSEAIGKICLENGLTGRFNCRQCGETGDTIAYLEKCENMNFAEALEEIGIKNTDYAKKKYKPAPSYSDNSSTFEPKSKESPAGNWLERVEKLVADAHAAIWNYDKALAWLGSRGISEEDIKKYKLGYIEPEGTTKQGRFRDRKAFGLEPKLKADGTPKKLFIPRGISIPTFRSNKITALRIRRHQEDLVPSASGYLPPKYMELEGSLSAPMVLLPQSDNFFLACWVVVEAQLDAILIHSATNGMVGTVAINSNRNKPDIYTHNFLKDSPRILLAMDYEDSGAGIAGLDFWTETYPQSKRWPTPKGKDPGEAFKLGVDINLWIQAALPNVCTPHKSLSYPKEENKLSQEYGQMDTSFSALNHLGEEGEGNNAKSRLERGREGLKEGYQNRYSTVEELSLFDSLENSLREDIDADALEALIPQSPEDVFMQNIWFLMDTFPEGADLFYFEKLKEILIHRKEALQNANEKF